MVSVIVNQLDEANEIHRRLGGRVNGSGGGGEVFEGMELCVCHAEVCGVWEGEGERSSYPEVACVAARQDM